MCAISYGSSTIAFSSSLNFGLETDRWSESDANGPTLCTGVLKNGNTVISDIESARGRLGNGHLYKACQGTFYKSAVLMM